MRNHGLMDPIRYSLLQKTAGAWLGSTTLPAALLAGRGAVAQTLAAPATPAAIAPDGARPQWPDELPFGSAAGDRAMVKPGERSLKS